MGKIITPTTIRMSDVPDVKGKGSGNEYVSELQAAMEALSIGEALHIPIKEKVDKQFWKATTTKYLGWFDIARRRLIKSNKHKRFRVMRRDYDVYIGRCDDIAL